MNCLFCPDKKLDSRDDGRPHLFDKYANCPRCRTNYVFEDVAKTKLMQYSFNTCYKQVAYQAIFDLIKPTFIIQVIKYPIREQDIIVSTNSLPNITPKNFYAKLGTYILFS